MLQTSLPTPAAPRTATAAAAMLLGAGLACAGVAHASSLPQPDSLDPSALPSQAASARDRDPTPVAAARGSMAGWKPVAHDKLDEMRGGFEMPGLQVSFGIERAVYINGALVVATSINIPDVGRITADQAARLATTLGPAIVASTNAAVDSALAGLTGGAGGSAGSSSAGSASAGSASAGSTGAAASASGTAGAASATSAAANGGSASASGAAGAAGLPATVVTTGTGQVVTNGLLNVIQNGAGNSAAVGSLAGTPATVIQNSMDNQSIRSLMTIDAGVNTLQAFRSQLANATLQDALMRAASMR
ncbi:flagellin [Cupriavidus consociatus]|uniref:flagellin n=1 Tax=Cupriavidus consociatus TaxID=2821357 RepID=UPI001AE8314E|nr:MULTISPECIES: flagellin [unclassified Cupriavidus]MBP0623569.1 flagellin [Cupriavidus sp. LEh25]MDK2660272.1 flagellin [Cupriavidus sp. LEh21]